ncbi:hypothetical protein DL1_08625 [Thioclava dalianensis]|uniref:Uncharacterized protein n=1 Tax=Thioclava dalianensis TaxID=1185766 RepID=A0A074U2F8_9RHOB|nr:hypothetical protein [Thioclava dalianensis]KEP68827.1 hypothetical protein DL1_08625 [Thioclava dalianensis]SFN49471.1 hypothetical protein SAMN05216224_10663 [Thioclava dalianensis]
MMTAATKPKVIISRDLKTAVMSKGAWRSKIRASDLPGWLNFYTKLAARRPGVYGAWIDPIKKAIALMEAT